MKDAQSKRDSVKLFSCCNYSQLYKPETDGLFLFFETIIINLIPHSNVTLELNCRLMTLSRRFPVDLSMSNCEVKKKNMILICFYKIASVILIWNNIGALYILAVSNNPPAVRKYCFGMLIENHFLL